jgi:hypothetical protein
MIWPFRVLEPVYTPPASLHESGSPNWLVHAVFLVLSCQPECAMQAAAVVNCGSTQT